MQVSARILGQEYGMSAEETNRTLVKLGYLQGSPGEYIATQKAQPYVVEKTFHRGTGGYACYNRYWTTRTFDDSIKDVLSISPELISEVRNEIAADRAARYAARSAEKAQAEAEFLERAAAEKAAQEAADQAALEFEERIMRLKNIGKITLIVSGVVLVGYGIYKVTPKIKAWWANHKHNENEEKCAKQ